LELINIGLFDYFKEKIRTFVKSEYRIIPKDLSSRKDQYGKSEAYKEKFYDVARYYQKRDKISQKEAIERASKFFEIKKAREAKIKEAREAETEVDDIDDYYQDVYDYDDYDYDFDYVRDKYE
jgi:hypothetical protein